MIPEFRTVRHGSPEYQAAVALRRRVLREPLGLDFSPDELNAEKVQLHGVIFAGEEPVAVAVGVATGPRSAKIRQVAVVPERRGEGLGKRIMDEMEAAIGAETFILHARADVVPFYTALGYEPDGDEFLEVGIPHRRMVKRRASTS